MGYMHIDNLYKCKGEILEFKEVYALEKVHGTSAHVSFKDGSLHFFSGGEKHENFLKLFDQESLLASFQELGQEEVIVFGEAYGGKQQGMSATYGKELCFIAFEVKIGNTWLSVDRADKVATKLGFEFVPYEKVECDVEVLVNERDRPSRVAKRRGILEDRPAEGIVIRPPFEVRLNGGDRLIAKFKRDDFSERKSKADTKTVDPEKLKILENAKEIADEWVTPVRLEHVLDKLPKDLDMKDVPLLIKSMQEDVLREAGNEIVPSKEALKAIGSRAVKLFTDKLKSSLK